jgi:NADH:ubiquinone oxidoreductase subunit K
MGSGLAVWVRDRTLRGAVVRLVLGMSLVLDVVAIAFFTLHDAMDGTRGAVLTIVVEATSKVSLFALAVALVDVAVGVATVPVLVEVGA